MGDLVVSLVRPSSFASALTHLRQLVVAVLVVAVLVGYLEEPVLDLSAVRLDPVGCLLL
jgi:hypothetical protein